MSHRVWSLLLVLAMAGMWGCESTKSDPPATPSKTVKQPAVAPPEMEKKVAVEETAAKEGEKAAAKPEGAPPAGSDQKKPQLLLTEACAKGEPAKCVELGDFYARWEKDPAKAKEAYKKACDIGSATGCEKMKEELVKRIAPDGTVIIESASAKGADPAVAASEEGLRRECEQDRNYKSCNDLGLFYVQRPTKAERDYPSARKYFRMACDGAETEGCNNLGYMYDIGDGVAKDHLKAMELYTMSCDNGNPDGCGKLGFLLDNGDYKVRNREKAAKVLEKACEGGSAVGCTNLGITLVEKPDQKLKAKKHFEKACERRYPRGCTMLGLMHSIGDGIPQDFRTANELWGQSCRDGHMGGCVALGRAFRKGEGVPEDLEKAREYYQMACDGGSGRGCRLLAKLPAAKGSAPR